MTLTRRQLDQAQCEVPDCKHDSHDSKLFLHSRCHPKAPTWAVYEAGVITVLCAECDELIIEIAVADAPPEPADRTCTICGEPGDVRGSFEAVTPAGEELVAELGLGIEYRCAKCIKGLEGADPVREEAALPLSLRVEKNPAKEIARIWLVQGGDSLHMAIDSQVFDEVDAWGIVMADVGKHIANFCSTPDLPPEEILEKIKQMFDDEWEKPTDVSQEFKPQ